MNRGYLGESGDGIRIYLRVFPGAKKTGIKGTYGERAIKLSVAAPPEKGRANAEAEHALAEILGVGISEVEVVRGPSSRDKVALVRDICEDAASKALDPLLGEYGG